MKCCFVPGCRTGYASKTFKKFSIFGPPKDPKFLNKWRNYIPRADRVLGVKDGVCELHFEEHFIERTYVHKINGEVVQIPRGKARLKLDAIPTIFPNLPSYYTTRIKPRKSPKKRNEDITRTVDETKLLSNISCECVQQEHPTTSLDECAAVWDWITNFNDLDGWIKAFSENQSQVCFTLIVFKDESTITPVATRQVIFHRDGKKPVLYVRGLQVYDSPILNGFNFSSSRIVALLTKIKNAKQCDGVNLSAVSSINTFSTSNVIEGVAYSHKCYGLYSGTCEPCTRLRLGFVMRSA